MSIFRKYDIKKTVAVCVWDSKKNDYVLHNVVIEIDSQALANHMGPKAVKSHTQQSVLLHGAVKVTPDRK